MFKTLSSISHQTLHLLGFLFRSRESKGTSRCIYFRICVEFIEVESLHFCL